MNMLSAQAMYNLLVAMFVSPLFLLSGIFSLVKWHNKKTYYRHHGDEPLAFLLPFGPPTAEKYAQMEKMNFNERIGKLVFLQQGSLLASLGILKILISLLLFGNFLGPLITAAIMRE